MEKYRAVLERRGAPLALTYYLNSCTDDEVGRAPRDFPPVDPARTRLDRKCFFEAILHDSDLPLVTTFLLSGIDVPSVRRAEDGWGVLHIAAAGTAQRFALSRTAHMPIRPVVPCFNPRILNLLIDAGAEVNGRSGDNGLTPLMIAAALQHTQTMRLFIKRGAALDMKDFAGRTCLSYAAAHPHVLQSLCDAVGMDTVRALAQQTWLLHEVCSHAGMRFAALYLVEQLGLDVNGHALGLSAGGSPASVLETHPTGQREAAPINSTTTTVTSDMMQSASVQVSIESVSPAPHMIDNNTTTAGVTQGDTNDVPMDDATESLPFYVQKAYTPLHCAVITGDVDLVRSLLDKGARCDTCDTTGRTALMLAQNVDGSGFFSRVGGGGDTSNSNNDDDDDAVGQSKRKDSSTSEERQVKKKSQQLRGLLSRLSSMVRSRHEGSGAGPHGVNQDDTYSYAHDTTSTKGKTNTMKGTEGGGDSAARRWVSTMLHDETPRHRLSGGALQQSLAGLPFISSAAVYDVLPYKVDHRQVRLLLERYYRTGSDTNQRAKLLQDPAPTLLHRFGFAALVELPICLALPHFLFYLVCRLTSSIALLLAAQLIILLGVVLVRNREAARVPQSTQAVRCFGIALGYWVVLTLITGRAYEMIVFDFLDAEWYIHLIGLFSPLGAGLLLWAMFTTPLTVTSTEGQRRGIYALIAQEEAKLSNLNHTTNTEAAGGKGNNSSSNDDAGLLAGVEGSSSSNGLITATTQPLMGVDLVTMVRKPLRAQRCRPLQRIVLRYDHYSYYLLCPIAAHNHRKYFWGHLCLFLQMCYELVMLYFCDDILSMANDLLGRIDTDQLLLPAGAEVMNFAPNAQILPHIVPFAFDSPAERFHFVYNYTLLPLFFILLLVTVAQQVGAITSNMTLFDYEHAEDESSLYCFVLKDKLYSLFDRGPLANLRGFFFFWTENLGVQLYRVPPLSSFLRRKVTQAKKWEKPACGDECDGAEGENNNGRSQGGCKACAHSDSHGHSHTTEDVTSNLHLQAEAALATQPALQPDTTNTAQRPAATTTTTSNNQAAGPQTSTQAAVMNLRQHIFNVMVQAGTDELGSFQYVGSNNNNSSTTTTGDAVANTSGSGTTVISGVPAESQQEWLQAVREARQMFHFYTQAKRRAAAANYAHGRGAIAEELREEQGIAEGEAGNGDTGDDRAEGAVHEAAASEARRQPVAGLRASAKAKDA